MALHPDNLRHEAREPARVMADNVFEVAYEELVEELNPRERADEPVPIHPQGRTRSSSLKRAIRAI